MKERFVITAKQKVIEEVLKRELQAKYSLVPDPAFLSRLAHYVEKECDLHESKLGASQKPFMSLWSAYSKWYSTTNMLPKELHKHSGASFCRWLSQRYWVLTVPKLWGSRKGTRK